MAQRSVLCIEPDAATVAEIRRAFAPHGLRVESIPNGESAIEWARVNSPSLIVLSVEPRKVGYAICNKLKRSPSLRDVPLILISSDETMATFEQHKKLKSRAEEYLLKPLDRADLVAKANRLIDLGAGGDAAKRAPAAADEEDLEEIELADDEIAEVSDDDGALAEDVAFGESDQRTIATSASALPVEDVGSGGVPGAADSLQMLGDLSRPSQAFDANAPSPFHDASGGTPVAAGDVPFDSEQFDQETQAAFAALEAGSVEGGTPAPESVSAGVPQAAASHGADFSSPAVAVADSDVVDLQSMWSDAELPAKMPWEEPPATVPPPAAAEITNQDSADVFAGGTFDVGFARGSAASEPLAQSSRPPTTEMPMTESTEDALLAGLGSEVEVPPLPEEVLYDERASADTAAKDQRIAELQARVDAVESEKRASEARAVELQGRIASLETERQTLRNELDEQHEQATHAANQGAFSKERDLLNLREIINRKEKDILDLRDALDAKERQILDHKDKIRENERARRDLEERTLGFEKSLVAANERVAELTQDKDKSAEREKGLKARLDDAHVELRKGQDEIEAFRKRIAQEIERGRQEVERTRIELQAKLLDAEEAHRVSLSKATDEWVAAEAAEKASHQSEVARLEGSHRAEIEAQQKRLTDEATAVSERLLGELLKLRREHEKAIAALKEEQALQLASERQAYETQTEGKHRAHRDEVMGLRRRHEEELTAAEDRRQRDILEQEQRRVGELEQAEGRRRVELQGRDEEHHARVTEAERRHLIEKTELAERHRTEHDQAMGRAARAEGELAARAQEIEQAYRRLAGFEADLDAARAELGDRDVKLGQMRDRVGELEAKVTDYEDQIVRAFQRLRADEKTTEKVRRALAVGLALLDERAGAGAAAQGGMNKPAAAPEESEKS